MRTMSTYHVFTFASTADALAFQAFCNTHRLAGRSIPVPSSIHAGCGLAWKCDKGYDQDTLRLAQLEGISYEGVHEVTLFD